MVWGVSLGSMRWKLLREREVVVLETDGWGKLRDCHWCLNYGFWVVDLDRWGLIGI